MSKLPPIEDYITAISTPQLIKADELKDGDCERFNGSDVVRYTGGFCIVFPYRTLTGKVAVRCWHAQLKDIQKRTKLISQELEHLNLPYFVRFHYIDNGLATSEGVMPIVVMDWVKASPLKDYIQAHLHDKSALEKLSLDFLNMVKCLHQHNISHGDLQHGNIMVRPDGSLVLVDYDSMYVPQIDGYADEVKGLEGYQHEARWKNEKVTPKADYFSELVIYLSIKALIEKPEFWDDLNMEQSETMLFSAKDIKSKGTAPIFKELEQYPNLSPLAERLIGFMQRDSIMDLEPLEQSIKSQSDNVVDSLSEKWNDSSKSTYTQSVPKSLPSTDHIAQLWKQDTANKEKEEKRKSEQQVSEISKKWQQKNDN